MAVPSEIRKQLQGPPPGEAVLRALDRLLANDEHLLRFDANERTIGYRFGMYLQDEFPAFHVDCEYNRDGINPKRLGNLDLKPDAADTEAKTVFPDIIVHLRGEAKNHLVIELKKSNSKVDRKIDFRKLRGYKSDPNLLYEYALFIELCVGTNPSVECVQWVDA